MPISAGKPYGCATSLFLKCTLRVFPGDLACPALSIAQIPFAATTHTGRLLPPFGFARLGRCRLALQVVDRQWSCNAVFNTILILPNHNKLLQRLATPARHYRQCHFRRTPPKCHPHPHHSHQLTSSTSRDITDDHKHTIPAPQNSKRRIPMSSHRSSAGQRS